MLSIYSRIHEQKFINLYLKEETKNFFNASNDETNFPVKSYIFSRDELDAINLTMFLALEQTCLAIMNPIIMRCTQMFDLTWRNY